MVLKFQGRTLYNVPDSASFTEHLKARGLAPGIYVFPDMPTGEDSNDQAKMTALNERYKAGPSGMLLLAPTGEDMMGRKTLGLEWATNSAAAFLAAWIVSLFGADVGFVRRWLAVVVIGLIAWLSIAASYGIWYRFPHDFVHDELYCALLEWAVAGLVIAAIVRRPVGAATAKPVSA
jgi:hypothetical protein